MFFNVRKIYFYAVRRFSPKKFGNPLFTFVYGPNHITTRVSRFPVGFLAYPLFPAVFHRLGQCFSWSYSMTDSHGILAKNWSSADACTGKWQGITCKDGRVFFIMACSESFLASASPCFLFRRFHYGVF